MSTSKHKQFPVLSILILLLVAGGAGLYLCKNSDGPVKTTVADRGGKKVLYYKSTMLLGEISDTPRQDSMGMDMVPVYEGEEVSGLISVDAATVQKMGLRTAEVKRGPFYKVVRTVGKVDFNETAVSDVNVRAPGWIENLQVDSLGKLVHAGEPLFDYYSPDLVVAQQEYLLTLGRGDASPEQVFAKLRSLGVPEGEIEALQKTKQLKRVLRMDSPRDGVVVEKNAIKGQRLEPGERLYRIADLGSVWVMADIYESDLPFIQVGQEAVVRLSYLPDRTFKGRVTYVYPTVDEQTRAVRVRMEFFNPGFYLKPGMYAVVQIESMLASDALLVPESAVLRSGDNNTVFVALEDGRFEPRTVSIGPRGADNYYQVLSGLNAGDKVVTSGQFLLDSESQLREAIQKMLTHGKVVEEHSAHKRSEKEEPVEPEKQITLSGYACPMPEHVSIVYDHAGNCPICGMKLVPVEAPPPAPVSSPSPATSPNPHAGHAHENH